MKKQLFSLIIVLLLLFPLFACADEVSPALQAYNGKRIGVLVGPIMEDLAHAVFPDSEYLLLNSYPDCVTALLTGKIDGYLGDEPGVKSVHAEQPNVDYIHERLAQNNYAFAFRKNDEKSAALCAELNEFIARCWADGTMQEIDDIWFGLDEDRKAVDMSGLTGGNGTIRVVTTSTDMPFSYMKDGKNVGYDIDLVVRFCRDRGYQLELGDVDFTGRIPAVQSGKYDFSTDMNVTPERMEQVLFSDPTSYGGIVLAVRASDLAAQAVSVESNPFTNLKALDGKRIGVQTGSTFDEIVLETLPDAKISYYNSYPDMAAALEAHKIDGFPGDEPVLRLMAAEDDQLTILNETMDTFEFGFVLPKTEAGEKLLGEINAWIKEMEASGELERIRQKWISGAEDGKTLPDYASFPSPNGTLNLVTEGAYAPMNYFHSGQVVGFEIDMAAHFCQAYGYGLKVTVMNFDSILPAVQSGKADFAAAGLTITEERKESVHFSDPYYSGGTVMAVLKEQESAAPAFTQKGVYSSLQELNGKSVGVQTGTSFADMVTKKLPDAIIEYYNTKADLVAALTGHKVETFVVDEPVAQLVMREDNRLTYLPEYLDDYEFAFVFAKDEAGKKLRDQCNAFLRQLPEGTLDALAAKWFGEDESAKTMPDIASFPAENGVLRVATESGYAPFEYVRNGAVVGYDMELAALFCQACGYGLEIVDMNFDSILPAVQTGKCSFAAAGISVTPERAESVLFSEPNFSGGTVAVVLKAEEQSAAVSNADSQEETFWDGITSSFNKTFIRENRWQLFLEGIGTTMLITLLSILFGTALGFLVFMLCRNGNPVSNNITRFSMWLVQGTPMVVLLMILYYVIFGSIAISGIVVAVIGFTLTFGASVYGLIKMGVGMIDPGQYEAAYALGHSNRHTFFKIILPQAIPHVLPAYQGEIVGLIKATAIVGYIAVQDLTKMGDIVRSRTYEAFFPLIAVTVIYFVLEGLLSFAVSRIRVSIDPKKRKRSRILKGVKTDD